MILKTLKLLNSDENDGKAIFRVLTWTNSEIQGFQGHLLSFQGLQGLQDFQGPVDTLNRVSSQVLRIPRKFFIQKPLIVLFPSNFLGLVVKREVTLVIFDTFVTNHILVVFSQLFCNFEDVVHPRF